MKKLVISEKNSVAIRLATILSSAKFKRDYASGVPIYKFDAEGTEYAIMGLRGHIVELDYPPEYNDWMKVDPKHLVYAEPYKRVTFRKAVDALIKEARDSDWVIIATDFDREGELIGLEALELLQSGKEASKVGTDGGFLPNVNVKRARFSSLGRNDVLKAFENLNEPDVRLARSAECRQVIDLVWGATLTRMISISANQVGKNFLSVGRVQSPTLSLISKREIEIEKFEPKKFYEIKGVAKKDKEFQTWHKSNPFWSAEEVKTVFEKVREVRKGTIKSVVAEEKEEYPPPPFSTTLFLIEATRLGYSGAEAMDIAERLYSSGIISYPRTDNTVYPRSLYLKGILEKFKGTEFESEAAEILAQDRLIPSRGQTETTDHPPIYPVEAVSRKKIGKREWPIYELVVRRFFATVAPKTSYRETDIELEIGGEPFAAKGRELLREGWRRYYPYFKFNESVVPELKEGDTVDVENLHIHEDKTKPPSRYSQGSLIREMEKKGLGTKSTRHEIIQKLIDRKYIQGQIIKPTLTGRSVSTALEQSAPEICDSKMTSHLEEDMDRIAEGAAEMKEVVDESREMLISIVDEIKTNNTQIGNMIKEAILQEKRIGKCPSCGGDLRIVDGPQNKFVGCSNYPECRVTYSLPAGYLVQPTDKECDKCGLPLIKLITRGQKPVESCVDPNCETNRMTGTIGKCPKCGKQLRVVRSQRGKRFLGCEGYPSCDVTYPLPQFGTINSLGTACEACGAPMMEVSSGRKGKWKLCPNMNCPSKKKNSKA